MDKMRTRFAPSPTGYMHVGNLRTALYAYLMAKKTGGSFILRIEDTDRERYVPGAVDVIYSTLREAGLNWDEGPDIGGPCAPYVQSERMGSYMEAAKQLVEKGAAYYCFCTKEEIEERCRVKTDEGEVIRYDGHCRNLSKEECERRIAAGEPFVIRQKMPSEGTTTFSDLVFGDITVDNSELEDQILIKSDGMPTYNFANVVDDRAMGITLVIRGTEYLSSAPKYNLLYEAFGWDIPLYMHCPPVMKDAQHKLSKRNGDASYQDLTAKGYLPAAIINYLALLGWSPKGEREIYSLEELVNEFDVDGVSKSPSIFDIEKLNYINSEYIRAMSPEEFLEAALPYIQKGESRRDIDYKVLAAALQPRCQYFSDIPDKLTFIDSLPDYDVSLYRNKKMKTDEASSLEALRSMLPVLEGLDDWNFDSIHEAMFSLIAEKGVKNGWMLYPMRVALSGLPATPGGGIELAAVLGKDESIARIKKGIELLSADR
ncbi:MAG: glutamate--tRNA ligase [Oscillospiraceae bacterium]|jgi:glutamyl-tRNA synthetase